MVEAFSLRGLSRLAESWRVDPPFPKDNEFGTAIADYRQNIIQRYTGLVPIQDYLRQWEASCAELQVSPALPTRLREILHSRSDESGVCVRRIGKSTFDWI